MEKEKEATPNAKSQIMYDPMIIPRVKQYLEENVHQTYVDVGVMAKLLQDRYREYSRRKAAPFRQLVEQAYKTVLRSYGLDSNPSSDDNDDISSDLEMMEDRPDLMNNMMTKMYMDKQGSGSAPPSNSNELIDISSDDSDSEAGSKKSNNKGKEIVKPNQNSHLTTQKVSNNDPKKQGSGMLSSVAKPKTYESNATMGQVVASFSRDPKRRKINEIDQLPPKSAVEDKASNLIKPAKIGSVHRGSAAEPQGPSSNVSTSKPNKKAKREFSVQTSSLKFQDVGGLDRVLNELWDLFIHIKNPKVYRHIGLPPPRGFLLHGPPGCGKTLLAQAIAGQLGIELIHVAATELVGGVSGESEERIRELFEQAATAAPCVLFIDEIDAISSNRQNAQKDMERRIVSQLLISLDGLAKHPNGDQVLIIGATSRPDSLDPALRRVGRFDQEISLGIPDRSARQDILQVVCANLVLSQTFDFDAIAALTPGYVGADLLALAIRAASLAVKRALRSKEEKYKRDIEIQTVNLIEETLDTLDFLNESAVTNPKYVVATIDLDEHDDVNIKNSKAVVADEKHLISSDIPVAKENADKKDETNGEVEPMVVEDDLVVAPLDEKKEELQTISKKTTENPEPVVDVNGAVKTTPIDESDKIEDTPNTEKDGLGENKTVVADPTTAIPVETILTSSPVSNTETDKNQKEPHPSKALDVDIEMENKQTTVASITPGNATPNIDEIVDLSDEEHSDTPIKIGSKNEDIARWLKDSDPILVDEDLHDICITMNDFIEAVKLVQPSAKREGFITVPDVTWDDIGSLRDIREELQLAVLAPVKFPQAMQELGLTSPSGVLLCGPPGCGKTLLAKAVANEAGVNFISVKGPELLNMYVGESERAVRQCFQRARNSAPCVIFFDEFDALCPTRSGSSENTSSSRVVNQLLTEMDGVEDRKGVFLLAATNRPDIVDPAVLRPGRLDKILYVGLPGVKERAEILQATTKKKPLLDVDVNIDELATMTDNYTGADLAGLVRQAALHALKQFIASPKDISSTENALRVNREDFLKALTHIRPSVSEEDKKHYAKLQKKYMVKASTPQ